MNSNYSKLLILSKIKLKTLIYLEFDKISIQVKETKNNFKGGIKK